MRGKRRVSVFLAILIAGCLSYYMPCAEAGYFEIGGKPLTLQGFCSQSVTYGLEKDQYDTAEDIQQLIFQVLLEANYKPKHNFQIFGSVSFNADWAYPLYDDSSNWKQKGFDDSRDDLYIFDDLDDVLKELHMTWTPNNFLFRIGKQIVKWGAMDGTRIMDQINPVDNRRGITDVEFENTILPLWMVRAEYNPETTLKWIEGLGMEFIFNPNAYFRGDEPGGFGNDEWGVWAWNFEIPLGGPVPFDFARLGADINNIKEPDTWDEGHEFAFRLKGVIKDTLVTLNYFNGFDNAPVKTFAGDGGFEFNPWDGRMNFFSIYQGYYPRLQFVGGTLTKDFTNIKSKALGGVSPVFRLEALYAFDTSFETAINTIEELDEIRWGVGIDWKVKIPFLNPTTYFYIAPELHARFIFDYPDNYKLNLFSKEDWYEFALYIDTSYLHNKLIPSIFYIRDLTNEGDIYLLKLKYEYNYQWHFSIGANFYEGEALSVFDNKDHAFFTISRRF